MLNAKQTERLVNKVARLDKVYERFLIDSRVKMDVAVTENGASRPIRYGDEWGGEFCYADFCFTVPCLDENKRYYLYADTGATEHLIYVNGREVGLTDNADNLRDGEFRIHKYVPLDNLRVGDAVKLEGYYSHTIAGTMPYDDKATFALNGYYPDRRYRTVQLVTFYEELYAFVCKLRALNAEMQRLRRDNRTDTRLTSTYIGLFETLSFKQQRPDRSSLIKASKLVDKYFAESQKDAKLPYVGVIGYSHLDTAWLWTVEETRHKLLRTVSNAVTLLNRYPDYRFFLSGVVYLKWLEEDSPELFKEVTRLIKQGRLEINGSSWVECDCNLVGSEALCRQFVRGKRYLRDKFGVESDTFWLPDTFGYSASLPQIMRQCNVKYFLTTKLSWNDTNRFPYESFNWQGLDGSKVTVHFNSIQTWVDNDSVSARLEEARLFRGGECELMAYGFGDGGGGPSDEMVERAVYTSKNCSFADVRHTTVSQFMDVLSERELPDYFGELYLELHRGTYTSNGALKQLNRRLEEALHDAELVSALQEDCKAETDALYDVLLLNQFHDVLPGTSIPEVTDTAVSQLTNALESARRITYGEGEEACYFNSLPFSRVELLPASNGQEWRDLDGNLRKLSYFEFDKFGYAKQTERSGRFFFDGKNIVTPQLKAKLKNGVLTSVIWHGRELVSKGFNIVRCAEDVPYIYDNWDIDADYALKERDAEFVNAELASSGDEFMVVRAYYKLTDKSSLITDMIFRADTPLITFDNKLSFCDDHTLVRTYFDTSLFSSKYTCDTQFGCVERNAFVSGALDEAKFEVCAHKWIDLSERGCGVSVLNDCKYGVSCKGGRLGVTLIKSGTHPDGRADNGVHRFRYAILPHEGALSMETVTNGYCFNYAPVLTRRRLQLPFDLSDCSTVVLETVKRGENGGTALRFYECLGASSSIKLTFGEEKTLKLCNVLEDVVSVKKGKSFTLEFKPFEIKTVVVD